MKTIYTFIFLAAVSFTANAQWTRVNVPHFANSYVPEVETPTANSVWAKIAFDSVGNDTRYFLRTRNGGATWLLDTITSPAGYVISYLAPIDGDTCYVVMWNAAVGNGGGIFKTTNGGKKWKQLAVGQVFDANSFPDFIYFFDAQHGIAAGDGNGPNTPFLEIYTTNDYGATWNRVPRANLPPTNGFPYTTNFNAYSVVGDRFWFRGFDINGGQFLYRSDDRGHHWQAFPLTVNHFFDFDFSDSLNGVSTGFTNKGIVHINVTHDGGITWKHVNYTGYPKEGFVVNVPCTSTFVSTIPGSSYSNDFGKTWILIDSGSNADHTALNFFNSSVGWTGEALRGLDTTGGMFKWTGFLPATPPVANLSTKNLDVAATKDNITNLSAYPNPVSNSTTISFTLQQAQNVSIQIFDGAERLIKTIANSQMQSGTHQFSWNAKNENGNAVIAGIYFLKMETESYSETKRIVVAK